MLTILTTTTTTTHKSLASCERKHTELIFLNELLRLTVISIYPSLQISFFLLLSKILHVCTTCPVSIHLVMHSRLAPFPNHCE